MAKRDAAYRKEIEQMRVQITRELGVNEERRTKAKREVSEHRKKLKEQRERDEAAQAVVQLEMQRSKAMILLLKKEMQHLEFLNKMLQVDMEEQRPDATFRYAALDQNLAAHQTPVNEPNMVTQQFTEYDHNVALPALHLGPQQPPVFKEKTSPPASDANADLPAFNPNTEQPGLVQISAQTMLDPNTALPALEPNTALIEFEPITPISAPPNESAPAAVPHEQYEHMLSGFENENLQVERVVQRVDAMLDLIQ